MATEERSRPASLDLSPSRDNLPLLVVKIAFPFLAVLLLSYAALTAHADQSKDPAFLFTWHQWFDLRDYVHSHSASPLYRGAVAQAFDERDVAEREFDRVFKTGSPADAFQARLSLIYMYYRSGQYEAATTEIAKAEVLQPHREDLRSFEALVAALARFPSLKVVTRRPSTLRFEIARFNKGQNALMFVPLTVNKGKASYVIDRIATYQWSLAPKQLV